MKKLKLKENTAEENDWLKSCLYSSESVNAFKKKVTESLSSMDIKFYNHIGELLSLIGFNAIVSREGDVNCRFDATIIDELYSIPIEIKSPKEDEQINIKSIRQALENKIVLLSRKFYPTDQKTTSLAIAQFYPPIRSDVYELIEDIYNAWGINIGIINLDDLLALAFKIKVEGFTLDKEYFNSLKGKLIYEKALYKE